MSQYTPNTSKGSFTGFDTFEENSNTNLGFGKNSELDNSTFGDFGREFLNLNYNLSLSCKSSDTKDSNIASTRSSVSDQNSTFSTFPQRRDFWLNQGPIPITNMSHRYSIPISNQQQTAIETGDSQDLNSMLTGSQQQQPKQDKQDLSNGGRKVSFTESDQNVSPVLPSGPFELDQSIWNAAAVGPTSSSSDQESANYGYNFTATSNNTSPTFASNARSGSILSGDFNLNTIQQQQAQMQLPQASIPQIPSANDSASLYSRHSSYFPGSIWTADQMSHSRNSSIHKIDTTSPQNAVSPTWTHFNSMGAPPSMPTEWTFPPPQKFPPPGHQMQQQPQPQPLPLSVQSQQQQQQQQQPQTTQFQPQKFSSDNFQAAAARRHSYAAVGDRQWTNEGYNGFVVPEGGYFNKAADQRAAGSAAGSVGHVQRLSADFGNLGLGSVESPNPNNGNEVGNHTSGTRQILESTPAHRIAYQSVDYYFTNDKHHRVHITDAGTTDTKAALDALAKKGAQLPRFPGNAFPGAKLVLIGFKAGRVDVFYLPENAGMVLKLGDLVVVEADRGQDLGKVLRLDVSIDEARLLKLRQHQEQQAALVDNEQLISSGVLPPINGNQRSGQQQQSQHQQQQQPQQPIPALHFPKPILRFADPQQVAQVPNKIADEEKACRVCSLKVHTHGLIMHVVDAEYQWDRRKLTFYYAANQRIDFRELVKELFRIYKTRIWMCAVSGGMEAVLKQEQQPYHNNDQDTMKTNDNDNNGNTNNDQDKINKNFSWNDLDNFK